MDNNEKYHDLTLKDFSEETLSSSLAVARHAEFTINLESFLKDVIRSNINMVGLVELGKLRYLIDLYLAAGPNNAKFEPCEITEEGVLKIDYIKEGDKYHSHFDLHIPSVIGEYLEKEDK
jgi:hypothetical protein